MGLFGGLAERALGACTRTLGEPVTVFPAAGDAFGARGIFDDDHTEVVTEEGVTVSSSGPMVSFQVSTLPAAPEANDELEVRGRRFVIVDVQADSLGTVDCILNELEIPEAPE